MIKDCWNLTLMLIRMYVFTSLEMVLITSIYSYVTWSPNFLMKTIWNLLLQDIQIRGVNRDEKSIQMAQQYPNSRHFLTYRHSLRVSWGYFWMLRYFWKLLSLGQFNNNVLFWHYLSLYVNDYGRMLFAYYIVQFLKSSCIMDCW